MLKLALNGQKVTNFARIHPFNTIIKVQKYLDIAK
jgi:hypothetical protein